jgi:hypothetical protein
MGPAKVIKRGRTNEEYYVELEDARARKLALEKAGDPEYSIISRTQNHDWMGENEIYYTLRWVEARPEPVR